MSAVHIDLTAFSRCSIACSASHCTFIHEQAMEPNHLAIHFCSTTRTTAFWSTSIAPKYPVDESTTTRPFIGFVSPHFDLGIVTRNFGKRINAHIMSHCILWVVNCARSATDSTTRNFSSEWRSCFRLSVSENCLDLVTSRAPSSTRTLGASKYAKFSEPLLSSSCGSTAAGTSIGTTSATDDNFSCRFCQPTSHLTHCAVFSDHWNFVSVSQLHVRTVYSHSGSALLC